MKIRNKLGPRIDLRLNSAFFLNTDIGKVQEEIGNKLGPGIEP